MAAIPYNPRLVDCYPFYAYETWNVNFVERYGSGHYFWRVVCYGTLPGDPYDYPIKVFLQNRAEALHFITAAARSNYRPPELRHAAAPARP